MCLWLVKQIEAIYAAAMNIYDDFWLINLTFYTPKTNLDCIN